MVVYPGLQLTDQATSPRALSRSGKKILHVDRHEYYGGEDAGLSLQEVVDWAHESAQGL